MFVYDADMEWDIGAPGTDRLVAIMVFQEVKWMEGNLQEVAEVFPWFRWFGRRHRTWLSHWSYRWN